MKLKGLILIIIGFLGLKNNYAALAACIITIILGFTVLFDSD
jgi:hypothetical protein